MLFGRLPQFPPGEKFWTGPEPVELPPAPATPPQAAPAPIPTPPLPTPPSPVLPTLGIETADAFEFDGTVLGNPGSPAEAFELLGFVPWEAPRNPFGDYTRGGSDGGFVPDYQPDGSVEWCKVDTHGVPDCDL